MNAQHTAEPVEITVLRTVNLPWQQPEVIITTRVPLDSAHVEVVVDGRLGAADDLWAAPAGTTRSLRWKGGVGRHRCDVRVTGVDANDKRFRTVVTRQVEVLAPLEVKFGPANVDLAARRLTFSSPSDVAFVEATLYDLDGRVLHQATTRFEADVPRKPNELVWPELAAQPARIALRVFSAQDTWADVEWSPIELEVAHEPIYFPDTMIVDGDAPKLADAHRKIVQALKEHLGVPGMRLYVLGLARLGENAAFAADRAHAVAKYLRGRGGIDLPVLAGSAVDLDDGGQQDHVQAILALQAPADGAWVEVAAARAPRRAR